MIVAGYGVSQGWNSNTLFSVFEYGVEVDSIRVKLISPYTNKLCCLAKPCMHEMVCCSIYRLRACGCNWGHVVTSLVTTILYAVANLHIISISSVTVTECCHKRHGVVCRSQIVCHSRMYSVKDGDHLLCINKYCMLCNECMWFDTI